MKAILEFDLPEDEGEFKKASNASEYSSILFEIDQYLRQKIKYEEHPEQVYKAYEEIRQKLHDLMNEASLDFY